MAGCNQLLNPKQIGDEARRLEDYLRQNIVGQPDAIEQIVNIYQRYAVGLVAPDRPVGNFLFLGPTGSGKTRTVEVVAEALVENPRAVIKIDCGEFQHSHEIAKLIGSPPGYLGHRETQPLLSQQRLTQHHTDKVKLSFVLFDEIEKASDSVWNLLLGILDKACLTLGDNQRVDFSKALIFMTGNVGASEISSVFGQKLGFIRAIQDGTVPGEEIKGKRAEKIAAVGLNAARKKFTPEFMNRLDHVIVFKALTEVELRRILSLELGIIQKRVLCSGEERAFVFTVTEPARNFLIEKGTDARYGARHLKRALEKFMVQPVSNLLGSGQIRSGDWVEVDHAEGEPELMFRKRNREKLDTATMASLFTGDRR